MNVLSSSVGLPAPFSDHKVEPASIYVVDDEAELTELYRLILQPEGYEVKSFNERTEALVALKGDRKKPDLLILDYFGHVMSAECFMQLCLQAHPTLRFLIVSGLNPLAPRLCSLSGDWFLQKPFSAKRLLHAIRGILAE